VLHQLGNLAYVRGEHAEARRSYERSLDIVEKLGDRAGVASTLGQLANLARVGGDLARAEWLYRRNLTIYQEMGDALTERTTLLNLALLYEDQGRLAEALPLLERAVHVDERMGLPTLEQDRSILRRVRLQMQPGCTGWIVRRATAFGRAVRQLRGNLALG
jgi:tetratricopeptide (TPR) repeat protein